MERVVSAAPWLCESPDSPLSLLFVRVPMKMPNGWPEARHYRHATLDALPGLALRDAQTTKVFFGVARP
ncbi:hypothetical protein JW905_01740, partial [bacterium]|nr:hypothetical protein [candidate division CSSED10-310 bacterium]